MDKINWESLLALTAEQVDDLRLVGYHYIRQGKYEIARSFFEALIILQSQKPLAEQSPYDYQVLGGLYLQLSDTERAMRYLDRALSIDATHIPTQLNRVKCLFILQRLDEAMSAADSLRECSILEICNAAEALQMAHRELFEAQQNAEVPTT